jgi:methylmalonyl-CoA mutase N-terminal domain/subunit
VAAVEEGYYQDAIGRAAYRVQRAVEAGDQIVVGVNRYQTEETHVPDLLRVSDEIGRRQAERLAALRAGRDDGRWVQAMDAVERAAAGDENLLPPVLAAVEAEATVGEIAGRLRGVWGEYAR